MTAPAPRPPLAEILDIVKLMRTARTSEELIAYEDRLRAAIAAAERERDLLTENLTRVHREFLEVQESLNESRAASARLARELDQLVEALTPSAETKAAYIGEFEFDVLVDADSERTFAQPVPWTTTKEIMAAILKRARANAELRGER